MPAKVTVIVYILICFEVGILLVILPWTSYWDDNFFLFFISGRAPWLASILQSGYMRGAVTALGALNLLAGCWESYRFRESVRAFAAWDASPHESANLIAGSPGVNSPVNLPDHRPPSVPPAA
jgi:hypothetical protein